MKSLEELLDDLAGYVDTPEESCVSLPPDAYLSPDLYALEVRAIFERSWLCVGREEYAPKPGDYYTIDVMGEPVVIVRGADGAIRALNTACRHRAMPVVTGRGNARRFVCPYHSWVYATDGRLVAAPHMEGSRVFSKADCRLPEYRIESWKGFLFVNLDDDAAAIPAGPDVRCVRRSGAAVCSRDTTQGEPGRRAVWCAVSMAATLLSPECGFQSKVITHSTAK